MGKLGGGAVQEEKHSVFTALQGLLMCAQICGLLELWGNVLFCKLSLFKFLSHGWEDGAHFPLLDRWAN